MKTVKLIAHPSISYTPIEELTCDVHFLENGDLQLSYKLNAEISQIELPMPKSPEACDNLWQHTCFEAFVAKEGEPVYYEFNFSPSSQWAAYAFTDYREQTDWQAQNPQVKIQLSSQQLKLTATIKAADLPAQGSELQLSITAVIEDSDGKLSYWALTHPSESPDFHHRDGFTLRID